MLSIKTQASTKILISGLRIMFDLTGLMPLLLSDSCPSHWHSTCTEQFCSLSLSPEYLGQLTLGEAKSIVKERTGDIDHQNDIANAPEISCEMLDSLKYCIAGYLSNLTLSKYRWGFFTAYFDALLHHFWWEDFRRLLIYQDFALADSKS